MTALVAAIGILLILVAIPFGLMLAPLVLGALFVWYGLRRIDDAVGPLELDERQLLGLRVSATGVAR